MTDIIGYEDIYSNKRIMKTNIAIDSKERDKKINSKNKDYSDPNDYQIVINKYKKFRNVISARIVEVMIPNTEYIVNNNNKYLDIYYNSNEINLEIPVGNYSFSSLAAKIQNTMTSYQDSSSSNPLSGFTVTLNNSNSFKTTIENNSNDIFTLLFQTGKNADCSIGELLGYDKIDQESISDGAKTTAVSDYSYHLNSTKYVDIKIDEIPDIGTTIDVKENIKNQILKRVPLDVDFGKEKYCQFDDKNYNFFTPIELSKLTIQIFNDKGKLYDSNRIDNYFILQLVMLQDKAPDNVGFNSIPNDIENKNQPVIMNKTHDLNKFHKIGLDEEFQSNSNLNNNNSINNDLNNNNSINNELDNNNSTNINNLLEEKDQTNTENTNNNELDNGDNSLKTNISDLFKDKVIPEGLEKNQNTYEIIEKEKKNIKDNVDFKFISEVIDNYKLAIFFGALILILLMLLKKK